MKTITIQIKDETVEAIDKVANSYDFRKYPIGQAYSLIIDELVLEVQDIPLYFPYMQMLRSRILTSAGLVL